MSDAIDAAAAEVAKERRAAWAEVQEELRYLLNLHHDKEGVRRSVEVIREALGKVEDCLKEEGVKT